MRQPNGSFVTKIDLVAQQLRADIATGQIRPGERLRQAEIAQRLGVSLAPVREALRLLEAKGLVESDPHRGARVVPVTVHDVAEVAQLRKFLEGEAIRLAVPHVDAALLARLWSMQDEMMRELARGSMDRVRDLNHAFHLAIYNASGQRRLVGLIADVHDSFPWEQIPRVHSHMLDFVSEHVSILGALELNDADRVARLQQEHIDHWRDTIISNFFSDEVAIVTGRVGVTTGGAR